MNSDETYIYNLDEVLYCTKCLSLRIMNVGKQKDFCYCDDCGHTDVASASIFEWERIYKERFGHTFLEEY